MKKNILNFLQSLVIASIIPFLLLSFVNIDNLIIVVLLTWLFNVLFGLSHLEKRQTFFLFNITFFVFLLGKIAVEVFSGVAPLNGYSFNTRLLVYLGLIITLTSLLCGQLLGEKHLFVKKNNCFRTSNVQRSYNNNTLVTILLILFYLTYVLNFLYLFEKASYVLSTSYLDLYTTYSSSIPYLLIKLGDLNTIVFVLLACAYKKGKSSTYLFLPFVLFIISSALTLFTGQRNIFVLNLIIFFVLLEFRLGFISGNIGHFKKNSTINHFLLILVIAFIPALVLLMVFVGDTRAISTNGTQTNVFSRLIGFFDSQGSQIEFFADTIEYKEVIWSQSVPYTFSSVYNYFRNLFGLINYGTYTVENALYGNSLAATQFYLTSPGSLLSGRGGGCCYLSELYFDFGFTGILLGSVFLGLVLSKLDINLKNSFWKNAFIVLMIRYIIYIPRASFFDWISYPFNIWNVALVIAVALISRRRTSDKAGSVLLNN